MAAFSSLSWRWLLAALPTPAGQLHRYLVADYANPTHLAEVVAADLAAPPAGYQMLLNNTGGRPLARGWPPRPRLSRRLSGSTSSATSCWRRR